MQKEEQKKSEDRLEEAKKGHQKLISDAGLLERLEKNEDFQLFQKEIVDRAIKVIEDDIYDTDSHTIEGQRKILIAVSVRQKLRAIFKNMFKIAKIQVKDSIKRLKDIKIEENS